LFHNKRQQKETGVPEIDYFLAHLAFKDNDATCNAIAAKRLLGRKDGGGAIGLSPRLAPTAHLQCSEVGVAEFAELVVMPCTHGKIREEVSIDLPVDS
jgi:hypothetical protein